MCKGLKVLSTQGSIVSNKGSREDFRTWNECGPVFVSLMAAVWVWPISVRLWLSGTRETVSYLSYPESPDWWLISASFQPGVYVIILQNSILMRTNGVCILCSNYKSLLVAKFCKLATTWSLFHNEGQPAAPPPLLVVHRSNQLIASFGTWLHQHPDKPETCHHSNQIVIAYLLPMHCDTATSLKLICTKTQHWQ